MKKVLLSVLILSISPLAVSAFPDAGGASFGGFNPGLAMPGAFGAHEMQIMREQHNRKMMEEDFKLYQKKKALDGKTPEEVIKETDNIHLDESLNDFGKKVKNRSQTNPDVIQKNGKAIIRGAEIPADAVELRRYEPAKSAFEMRGKAAKEEAKRVKTELEENVTDAVDSFKSLGEQAEGVGVNVGETATELQQTAVEAAQDAQQAVVDEVEVNVHDVVNELRQEIPAIREGGCVQETRDKVTAEVQQVESDVEDATQQLLETQEEVKSKAHEAVNEVTNQVKDVQEDVEAMDELLKDSVETPVNQVQQTVEETKNEVKDAVLNTQKTLQSVKSKPWLEEEMNNVPILQPDVDDIDF